MKKISSTTVWLVIIPVILGFLAGILGHFFVGTREISIPFFGRIDFSNTKVDRKIIIDQPRNVIVKQDLQLRQIENELLPALIGIYQTKKANDPFYQARLDSELLGQGFVLTADGWIVTTCQVIKNFQKDYLAIGYQNKEYQLDNFILDETTGAVFAKMKEAEGLAVAKLGDSKDISTGQTAVVASFYTSLTPVYLTRIGYQFQNRQDLLQTASELNKRIFLSRPPADFSPGSILTNLEGGIIGLVFENGVVPSSYFNSVIGQVLKNQEINRPVLGVSYLDLAQIKGLSSYGEKGALIYGAPVKGSSAQAKLKSGDLIKKIDDVEINIYQSLSELLNDYRPGDRLELLIERAGQETVVELELK